MRVTHEEIHASGSRRARGRADTGRCCDADPLAAALLAKARTGAAGATEDWAMAAGEGWRVADVVCTCGPRDRPFEERQSGASISLVLSGTFVCRGEHGASLLSAGSLMLVSPGQSFECSHTHGEGDRCLSFQFDARAVRATGARCGRFTRDLRPPIPSPAARPGAADGAGQGGDGKPRRARGDRRRAGGCGGRHRRPRAP